MKLLLTSCSALEQWLFWLRKSGKGTPPLGEGLGLSVPPIVTAFCITCVVFLCKHKTALNIDDAADHMSPQWWGEVRGEIGEGLVLGGWSEHGTECMIAMKGMKEVKRLRKISVVLLEHFSGDCDDDEDIFVKTGCCSFAVLSSKCVNEYSVAVSQKIPEGFGLFCETPCINYNEIDKN